MIVETAHWDVKHKRREDASVKDDGASGCVKKSPAQIFYQHVLLILTICCVYKEYEACARTYE